MIIKFLKSHTLKGRIIGAQTLAPMSFYKEEQITVIDAERTDHKKGESVSFTYQLQDLDIRFNAIDCEFLSIAELSIDVFPHVFQLD